MRVPVLLVVAAAVLTSVLVAACRAETSAVSPSRLRLGVAIPPSFNIAPDVDGVAEIRRRYAPLAAYLEAAIQLPVDLSGSRNADAVTADFEAGRYDLAFVGAAHFAHAYERTQAFPLVMRDEDRRSTSVFVAAAGDPRTRLDEFRGARFGFGPVMSSSHLMSRSFLERHDIVPETFFSSVT